MNQTDAIKGAFDKLEYFHSKTNAITILNAYGCDLHLGEERIEQSAYSVIDEWKPENTVYLGLMEDDCNLTVDGVKELMGYLNQWLQKQITKETNGDLKK